MSDSRFEIVIFYLEVLVVLFDLLLEDDELGISCAQVFIFDPKTYLIFDMNSMLSILEDVS